MVDAFLADDTMTLDHRMPGTTTTPIAGLPADRVSSATGAALVASTGFFLAWMLPYHTYPYWSFYSDYLSLLGVVAALLIHYFGERRPMAAVPAAVALPLGLAAVIGVDALTGRMWAPREAVIPIGYLVTAAGAMLLGRNLANRTTDGRCDPSRTIDLFCGALLAAGLLSALITFCQYLGVDDRLGDWSEAIGTDGISSIRPYANLGQPNQLALLLCWSLAALWRSFMRRATTATVGLVLATVLLASLALTQSKVAWLIVPALVVLTGIGQRRLGDRKVSPAALVALLVLFVAFVLVLPHLGQFTGTPTEDVTKRMETNGVRSVMILQGLYIGVQHPLLGVGWSGFGAAQVGIASWFGETQYAMHAHDFVANLAAETGWVVTFAVVAGIAWWLYRRYVRQAFSVDTLFTLMVFAAVAIHSLVEFPLWYAYVLLPVGFLIGLTDAELDIPSRVSISRVRIVVPSLVVAVALAGVAIDYRGVVQAFRALGLQRIGFDYPQGSTAEPRFTIFPHFYRYMQFADLQPTVGMPADEIRRAEDVAHRFGYAPVLMRLATIYALNDRTDDAVRLVVAMRHLYPQRYRETYGAWRSLAKEYPQVLGKVFERLPSPDSIVARGE